MSKTKELVQPVVTDTGERVIPGTRRPDGTVRKERRIREGYTPQDEQPVYVSRGVLVSAEACMLQAWRGACCAWPLGPVLLLPGVCALPVQTVKLPRARSA